ncbi:MAG: DUF4129 domain-containing protein, partial [Candidatus Acidiferrales bacterium]
MKWTAQILRLVLLLLMVGALPVGLWSRPGDLPAPSRAVTLHEYIAELSAASAALDGGNPEALRAARSSLPGDWVVQNEGQSIRVKTDWINAALLAAEKAPKENAKLLTAARGRLAALRESAESLESTGAGANLEQSRAEVDRILKSREFQGSREPSWLDKLKARVFGWISRHLDKLFGHMGVSAPVGNAIAWILVALAGLLLALWAVRSVMNAARRSEMDLSGSRPAGKDWRYWAGIARAAAERGDYRAAIHAAYWAAVAQLEEIRLLPEDRSRTPRESLRLLKRGSAAYGPLAQLTRCFEITWYGYHAATLDDWDDVKRQLESLECLRSSTRATAHSYSAPWSRWLCSSGSLTSCSPHPGSRASAGRRATQPSGWAPRPRSSCCRNRAIASNAGNRLPRTS